MTSQGAFAGAFGGAGGFGSSFGAAPGSSTTFGSSSTAGPAFGTSAPAFGSAALSSTAFGQPATSFGSGQPSTTTTTFGSGAPKSTTFGTSQPSSTAFGSGSTTPFGTAPTTFGSASSAPVFGSGTTSGSGPTFGSAAPTASSVLGSGTTFGSGAPTASPAFGGPSAFGSASTTTFGTPTSTPAFGSATTSPAFGTPSSTPAFGGRSGTTFGSSSSTSVFGKATARQASLSPFPSSPAPTTVFGSSSTTPAATPAFGVASQPPSSSIFGSAAPSTTFGSSNASVFGAAAPPSTVFGSSSTPSATVFGAKTSPKPSTSATGIFGASPSATTTTFGAAFPPSASSEPSAFSITSIGDSPFQKPKDERPPVRSKRRESKPQLGEKNPLPPPSTSPSPSPSPPSRKPRHRPPPPVEDTTDPAASDDDLPQPPAKTDLAEATHLEGTCVDMCSPKELEMHLKHDELSAFEKGPDAFAVKKFQRSSASHKLDIPSEVRPLGVLRSTQLYLEQHIMDRERLGIDHRINPPRVPDLLDLYNFLWDRTRMIRKDISLQNYRGGGGRTHPIAMDIHERIARYYILSQHELIDEAHFVVQQNVEQFGKTLRSLLDFYDDARAEGLPSSPFEPEFAGYYILGTLHDGGILDVLKFTKSMPPNLLASDCVQFAWAVFVARRTNDYVGFFRLVQGATYLQACLMHQYFPNVRSKALEAMNAGYKRPGNTTQEYPIQELTDLLCFEDEEHTALVCELHGLTVKGTDVLFGVGDFRTDSYLRAEKTPVPNPRSDRFISIKQGDLWRRDVVRGATEYTQEAYPALDMAVKFAEDEERKRLYPERPPYEDVYSTFATSAGKTAPSMQAAKAPPLPKTEPPPRHHGSMNRTWTPNSAAAPSSPVQPPLPPPLPPTRPPSIHRVWVAPATEAAPTKSAEVLHQIEERQAAIANEKAAMLKRLQDLQSLKQQTKTPAPSTAKPAGTPPAMTLTPKRKPPTAAVPSNEEDEKRRRAEEEDAKARDEAARVAALAKQKQEAEEAAREAAVAQAAREAAKRAEEAAAKAEAARRAAEEARARAEAARLAEEARRRRQAEEDERLRREAIERERLAEIAARKAFSDKWLRTNFDERAVLDARWAKEAAAKAAARRARQHLAIKRLRFALWKRFLHVQRDTTRRRASPVGVEMLPRSQHESAADVAKWIYKGFSRLPRCLPPWSPQDEARSAMLHATRSLLRQNAGAAPVDLSHVLGAGLVRRYPGVPTIHFTLGLVCTTSDAWTQWWTTTCAPGTTQHGPQQRVSVDVETRSPTTLADTDDCVIVPVTASDMPSLQAVVRAIVRDIAALKRAIDVYVVILTALDPALVARVTDSIAPLPSPLRRVVCVAMTWPTAPVLALQMLTSLVSPHATLHTVCDADLLTLLEDVLESALYEAHCRRVQSPTVLAASIQAAFETLSALVRPSPAVADRVATIFAALAQPLPPLPSSWDEVPSFVAAFFAPLKVPEPRWRHVVQAMPANQYASLLSFLFAALLESVVPTPIVVAVPSAWLDALHSSLRDLAASTVVPPKPTTSTPSKRKLALEAPRPVVSAIVAQPAVSAIARQKTWALQARVKRTKSALAHEQSASASYRDFLQRQLAACAPSL
ncbi:hypothetical protein SDRG_12940 [Saprolegnia diclina VS20]|uniref:SAC3/GANP/THP3 conserved domain-containing protein n=1 Tax=Saprolegnia diclina (strain VS20) TaxID=1156394 RepID=T0RHI5_SAPDV|nr:hypothetical protein SDRG_12940 [Saprolegnia diclina VS20]EQC29272.1 hypothetical protein SDRG_12940 [Saprolegnia diclina VS20]|eukprot:XP_008617246.1 hypothetical protein SDRG_12940 [Saprolegnia diclina VS20]